VESSLNHHGQPLSDYFDDVYINVMVFNIYKTNFLLFMNFHIFIKMNKF